MAQSHLKIDFQSDFDTVNSDFSRKKSDPKSDPTLRKPSNTMKRAQSLTVLVTTFMSLTEQKKYIEWISLPFWLIKTSEQILGVDRCFFAFYSINPDRHVIITVIYAGQSLLVCLARWADRHRRYRPSFYCAYAAVRARPKYSHPQGG